MLEASDGYKKPQHFIGALQCKCTSSGQNKCHQHSFFATLLLKCSMKVNSFWRTQATA